MTETSPFNVLKIINVKNFHQTCRICLHDSKDKQSFPIKDTLIDENPLSVLLETLISLNIDKDPPQLPDTICQTCLNLIVQVVELREVSRVHGNILRFALNDKSSTEFLITPKSPNGNEVNVQPLVQTPPCKELKAKTSPPGASTQRTKRLWHCKNCPEGAVPFSSSVQLKIHQDRIHGLSQSVLKCTQCSRISPHKYAFRLHKSHHDFLTKIKMDDLHLALGPDKTILKCPKCWLVFDEFRSFRTHMEEYSKPDSSCIMVRMKKFVCRLCTKSFANQDELNSHIISHRPYSCGMCKSTFRSRVALNEHTLRHLGVKCTRKAK